MINGTVRSIWTLKVIIFSNDRGNMGDAKQRRAHCAYCGAPKVSDDHVPPRNLFLADKTNLITVPACHEHNGKRSDLDEKFRNYVMSRVGGETPATQPLFEKMVRGVTRDKKRHQWNPHLSQFEVKIESDAFRPMIEWITRGLYWHVYGERLPLDTQMRTAQMRIGEWLPEFVSDMGKYQAGGTQFLFACKRMDDHPTVSIWVYVFHWRLIAMAMTNEELSEKLVAEALAQEPGEVIV
jgi:hypothetical protein